MKEQRLEDVLQYRLQQADEAVIAAKLLAENGHTAAALNRIYYGMFYVITALAVIHSFKTSKHQRLLGWFTKEFGSTGKVSKDMIKIARNAFEVRMESDYDALVNYTIDDVLRMIPEMEQFIKEIKRLLFNYNSNIE